MIDSDVPGAPAPRRLGIITRTLRPLQKEMGPLQERLAFLNAKLLFNQRKESTPDFGSDLAQCSADIVRMRAALEAAVQTLPVKSRRDTRLADTRLALDRAEHAISALSGSSAA
jgi:hypothetical protein